MKIEKAGIVKQGLKSEFGILLMNWLNIVGDPKILIKKMDYNEWQEKSAEVRFVEKIKGFFNSVIAEGNNAENELTR